MIGIRFDARDFTKGAKKMAQIAKKFPKDTADSMNIGLEKGSKEASTMISSIYAVDTPSLKVNRASPGNLKGSVEGEGGMKHVQEFSPSSDGERPEIVSVTIKRGSRKPITPQSRGPGRGAFMTSDGRVMERRQDAQYPIFPVMTIGIPQMLGSKKISNPVRDLMGKVTMEELRKRVFK